MWVFVLAAAAFAAAQTYTITEIGTVKGDNENSGFGSTTSAKWSVVPTLDGRGISLHRLVPGQHAFSWTKAKA